MLFPTVKSSVLFNLLFFWKVIHLVLVVLMIIFHTSKNLSRQSRLACKLKARHVNLTSFVSFTAFELVWCKLLSKSFLYRLNKMGLNRQPCITPFSQSMNSVRHFPIFTAQHDCLYKDSMPLVQLCLDNA